MSQTAPALSLIAKAAETARRVSIVDECELILWREMQPALNAAIGEFLAAYGDRAPANLIELQHMLTELGRFPFGGRQ